MIGAGVFRSFCCALDALRRNVRGVSVIEFALMTPIYTTTMLYGIDTIWFVHAHQEMSRLAISTADLAARYRASIDEKDIQTLFLGAKLSTDGIAFDARGRVMLSSVTRNAANNGHWVRWQRCQGQYIKPSKIGIEDAGKLDATLATINGQTLNVGDNVMFAEVFYKYQPLFFKSLFAKDKEIKYTAMFMAREIALPSLTNSTNIAEAAKLKCTT